MSHASSGAPPGPSKGDGQTRAKTTSEPADADSLMTRLDGTEGPSSSGVQADGADSDRGSSPGPISSRGRRKRGGIRVPDDSFPATPAPAPVRTRSFTPPAFTSGTASPSGARLEAAAASAVAASPTSDSHIVRGTPLISIGGDGARSPHARSAPLPNNDGDTLPASMNAPRMPQGRISTPAPMPSPLQSSGGVVLPPTLGSTRVPTPMPMMSPVTIANVGGEPDRAAASTAIDAPPPRPTSPSRPPPPRASVPPPAMPRPGNTDAYPTYTGAQHQAVPVPSTAHVTRPVTSESSPHLSVTTLTDERSVQEALELLEREELEQRSLDVAHPYGASGGPAIEHTITIDHDEPARSLPEVSLSEEEFVEVPSSDRAEKQPLEATSPQRILISAPTPPPRRARTTGEPTSVPPRSGSTSISTPPPHPAVAHSSEPDVPVAAPHVSSPPASPDGTSETKKKKRAWFEDLFNDDFARTSPPLPASYLNREADFIEESLGCEQGATILDLGCGTGEHAVALAKRGYDVVGLDLSLSMLARATEEGASQKQRVVFAQGDMREMSYEDAFDGVYCWGTTFGYFDDAKNAEVITKLHRALRRGGRLLLDIACRDFLVGRSPSMVWFEGTGCVCMDEMFVNPITSRLQIKRTMMLEDGRQREIDYSIRLYALHELGKLLHDSGFRVAEVSGDTATPGVYFGAESPRLIVLAEKR